MRLSPIFLISLLTGAIAVSVLVANDHAPASRSADANKADQPPEEKPEKLLTNLENGCKKLVKTQITIQNGIKNLHKVIEATAHKKPQPKDRQAALKLADSVKESVKEVDKLIEMLHKDAAVAFPEVFQQLRDDMIKVKNRLEKCDVGAATRELQQDIVDTLREMTEALKSR